MNGCDKFDVIFSPGPGLDLEQTGPDSYRLTGPGVPYREALAQANGASPLSRPAPSHRGASFIPVADREYSSPASKNYTTNVDREYEIERQAIAWLSLHTEHTPQSIEFDRWVNLGPKRKRGEIGAPRYIARKDIGNNGMPFVSVTFSTFKGGGYTETWKSWENTSLPAMQKAATKLSHQPKPRTKAANAEALDKLKTQARVISEYHQAAESGPSPYLTRKRVADFAVDVHGIRYAKDGSVYIPLQDADGIRHAVQRISDKSKFVFGPGRGHFAIIGKEPAKGKPVYMTEGVATGLSVYAALGGDVCVIAAISATNIDAVAKALTARHGRDLGIIFCADNDKWDKKTGRERNINPGLETAHHAALKSKHHRVAVPNGLQPGQTDFNDMHLAQGLHAVAERLHTPERADPAAAFASETRKLCEKAVGRMHQRYLPELNLKPGVNLVRSPIGTGKTYALAPHAKKSESFLYISHLINLAIDVATRKDTNIDPALLNLDIYLDQDAETLPLLPHLAICLNSLYKLSNGKNGVKRFQYVIVDEIEQLLQRLTTKIENKDLIISTLIYLLNSAEYVVLLDAHLGENTREFLKAACPERETHQIINYYQPGKGRTITLYDDDGDVQEAAMIALKSGLRVFLTCNSKRRARQVFDYLRAQGEWRGLYISGDNGGDPEVRAFFSDVNAEARKYDFIVTTPAANTGISIDTDATGKAAFDFVGGIFKTGINSPTDALQALGRVRGAKNLHVWIERKRKPPGRSPDEIEAAILTAGAEARALGIMPTVDDTGRRTIADTVYTRLCKNVISSREWAQFQYFEKILKQAAIEGYSFEWAGCSGEAAKEARKEAQAIESAEYLQRITGATEIDGSEAAEIDRKNRRTMAETDSLERFNLKNFYGDTLGGVSEAAQFDRRGEGRRAILKIENALADKETIRERHMKQAHELEADKRAIDTQQIFGRALLASVGVNSRLESNGTTYTANSPQIQQFVEFNIRNRETLGAAARIPTDSELRANPLKFIGEQLKRHGLKQHRIGRNAKGAYSIDLERLEIIKAVVGYRAETRIGDTPGDHINKTAGMSPDISDSQTQGVSPKTEGDTPSVCWLLQGYAWKYRLTGEAGERRYSTGDTARDVTATEAARAILDQYPGATLDDLCAMQTRYPNRHHTKGANYGMA